MRSIIILFPDALLFGFFSHSHPDGQPEGLGWEVSVSVLEARGESINLKRNGQCTRNGNKHNNRERGARPHL